MTGSTTCESCGMPIETGRYCQHCVDGTGALQSFGERFERMIAWEARRSPDATRDELEASPLAYMATPPCMAGSSACHRCQGFLTAPGQQGGLDAGTSYRRRSWTLEGADHLTPPPPKSRPLREPPTSLAVPTTFAETERNRGRDPEQQDIAFPNRVTEPRPGSVRSLEVRTIL